MNESEISEIFEKHRLDACAESWSITDIDKQMEDGDAIIHWVSRYGTASDLCTLIRYGASINLKGDIGRTPLMEAVAFDKTDTAKVLIDSGSDLTLQDDYGDTIYTLVNPANEIMTRLIGCA